MFYNIIGLIPPNIALLLLCQYVLEHFPYDHWAPHSFIHQTMCIALLLDSIAKDKVMNQSLPSYMPARVLAEETDCEHFINFLYSIIIIVIRATRLKKLLSCDLGSKVREAIPAFCKRQNCKRKKTDQQLPGLWVGHGVVHRWARGHF